MSQITMATKHKLIIGLDVPNVKMAETLVSKLGDDGVFYKIGYQLAFIGGLEFAEDLIKSGKKVFLDLKLLDIDNTVAKTVEILADKKISMLTLHAYPKVMRAAVAAAKGSSLCLLGVTVLTSMDEKDLFEAGYNLSAEALVLHRAKEAKCARMGGIVASAQEAYQIRQTIGNEMALVTPGIRLLENAKDDQKRVMLPSDALKAGASHLVVARPIIHALDPVFVCRKILLEMEQVSA